MNSKKLKLITLISLILVALSIVFTFALLALGIYGESLIPPPTDTGDASQNLGAGIAFGCATTVSILVIVFALIVKLASLIVGISTNFARRKKASIATGGAFACIFAVLSLFLGFVAISSYSAIADNNFNAILIYSALIFALATDLLWLIVAILRAVFFAKEAKKQKIEQEKIEEENRKKANEELKSFVIGEEEKSKNENE